MTGILLHALTAALYAVLAGYLWITRWTAPSAVLATPTPARTALSPAERTAILLPWLLHSYLLWQLLYGAPELRFGFGHALSAMLWLAVAIYWIENLFVRVEGMQPLVLGLAALCAPLPALFPGFAMPAFAGTLEFRLHLTLAMLAYSLFTLAALHALLMTLVERRLHGKPAGSHGTAHTATGALAGPLSGPLVALPPLLTLEALLFRIIGLGFVLLTLTLATGAAFSEALFGRPLSFDHKTVFAILSWIIFAVLLTGRYRYGWRGRMALRYTLAGFFSLLLAYVGSRFVLEVILHRPQVI
jgi:ABC-type uncharacterized transport system permease subunit